MSEQPITISKPEITRVLGILESHGLLDGPALRTALASGKALVWSGIGKGTYLLLCSAQKVTPYTKPSDRKRDIKVALGKFRQQIQQLEDELRAIE